MQVTKDHYHEENSPCWGGRFSNVRFFLVGKSLKKMVESGEGALALRNDSLGSKLVWVCVCVFESCLSDCEFASSRFFPLSLSLCLAACPSRSVGHRNRLFFVSKFCRYLTKIRETTLNDYPRVLTYTLNGLGLRPASTKT